MNKNDIIFWQRKFILVQKEAITLNYLEVKNNNLRRETAAPEAL